MKKHLRLILIMVFAVTLTLVLSGCGKGSTDFEGKNVVTFDLCGGTMETKSATVKTQINFAYEPGTYILDPIETLKYTLNKPEYIFTGWYTSPECKSADEGKMCPDNKYNGHIKHRKRKLRGLLFNSNKG